MANPTETTEKLMHHAREQFGDFAAMAAIVQYLKQATRAHRSGVGLPALNATQQEAMDMILHSVGRVINGDANGKKGWQDIATYALRVVERAEADAAAATAKVAVVNEVADVAVEQPAPVAPATPTALQDQLLGIARGLSYNGTPDEASAKHALNKAAGALRWINQWKGVV